jgi:uncharacterized protein (DUF58 family)
VLRRRTYRLFRAFSSLQHRLARRLTPAGRLVVAVLVGAVIMGPNTRLTTAYQAVTFLITLLALALTCALRPPAPLSIRRALPRFGTAGEPVTYRLAAVNAGAAVERGLSVLEDLEDPRPSFEDFVSTPEPGEERRNWFDRKVGYPRWAWLEEQNRRAEIGEQALGPVPPGGAAEVPVTFTPRRRGVVRFRGATLARTDPFGLVRALTRVEAPGSLLVLPRRHRLPPLALPGSRRYQPGGIALATSVGDSEEFASLREYRPGDPPRRIHWRSWARAGKPIVKEFQDEFFVRHGLVLDTFQPEAAGARFEDAVSVAASFAASLETQESLLDLMFVGPEAYCFTAGRGVGHADRMLEILACVRPCRDRPFAALHGLVIERQPALSGCIAVLLAWDDDRRRLVGALRGLGVPTLVLLVATPDEPEPPDAGVHRLEVGRVAEGLARL